MGMTAELYRRCGGFPPLPAHEDVALVRAMAACGAMISRKLHPAVSTSARRNARAVGGFSDYLKALEARLHEPALATWTAVVAVAGTAGSG